MKHLRNTILASAVAAALTVPFATQAASNSGATSAGVNLQFSVLIPSFVFLRVGDIAPASVNTLAYAPTVDQMINSTAILPTGGDVGSDVTIRVLGNAGDMTLAASNLVNLTGGLTPIPTTTLTGSNPTGSITVPPFNGSVGLTANVNNIVNQSGTWRYAWANPAGTVYAAGTYTGTVTYTLSAP